MPFLLAFGAIISIFSLLAHLAQIARFPGITKKARADLVGWALLNTTLFMGAMALIAGGYSVALLYLGIQVALLFNLRKIFISVVVKDLQAQEALEGQEPKP